MHKARYILFVILSCLALYISFRIYVPWKTKHEIKRTLSSKPYMDRMGLFNNTLIDSNSIVFLGNSLIANFDLSLFNNPHTVNRGISGDFTEGVIKRMDGIIKHHPKKIFIEIGINDLVEKVPLQVMQDNYDTILQKIANVSPHTEVYIFSLLPTIMHGGIITGQRSVNNRVIKFNWLLKKFPEKHHCTYIDTWSHFASKDNSMNPALTTDGIHLTDEGYRIWRSIIEDLVK